MISKEKAQEFLKTKENKDFKKSLLKKVNALKGDAKQLGQLFLNEVEDVKDTSTYGDWPVMGEERSKWIKILLHTADDWDDFWKGAFGKTLEALFAEKAPFVKEAWNLRSNKMYQTGWRRRSFRSPANRGLLINDKINWLYWLVYSLRYDLSLEDYVRYAGYLGAGSSESYLFCAAAQSETEIGRKVFDLMLDTAYGRDDIAIVNHGVLRALLMSNEKEAWEAVEKLLLSAQRQEGLRQEILQSLDESSLEAFKYFIKVIIDNDLARFSAVTRALDVWMGMAWEGTRTKLINEMLVIADEILNNPSKAETYAFSKNNLHIHLALWATGCHEINDALELAKKLLETGEEMKQAVALRFLLSVGLKEEQASIAYDYIKHSNLMIAGLAVFNLNNPKEKDYPNLLKDLEALWERVPEKGIEFHGKIFEWHQYDLKPSEVMDKMLDVCEDSLERLHHFFDRMDVDSRGVYARRLILKEVPMSKEIRPLIVKMVSDKSSYVRSSGFTLADKVDVLDESEVSHFEGLLTRKSADLRLACIGLLTKREDKSILESADRLLQSKKKEQRLGGLDLLVHLTKKEGGPKEQAIAMAKAYQERQKVGENEQIILNDIYKANEIQYGPANGFGLYELVKLTVSPAPQPQPKLDLSFDKKQIVSELKKLEALVEEHKDHEYEYTWYDGAKNKILIGHSIRCTVFKNPETGERVYNDIRFFPLREVWEKWWKDSKLTEWQLVRVVKHISQNSRYHKVEYPVWVESIIDKYQVEPLLIDEVLKSGYDDQVSDIVIALSRNHWSADLVDRKLDYMEAVLSEIPAAEMNTKFKQGWHEEKTWRNMDLFKQRPFNIHSDLDKFSDKQFKRYWQLWNWIYQSAEEKDDDDRPELPFTLEAYKRGFLNDHDVLDKLMASSKSFRLLSNPKYGQPSNKDNLFKKYDFLKAFYDKCVERILEIELKRGDSETTVSNLAIRLNRIHGADYLIRILQALGKDTFTKRSYYWYFNKVSKKDVLSKLLQHCYPLKEDTPASFKKQISSTEITTERLVEVAMYAPQWIPFIEPYIKWKGLAEGVWWFHAHTKQYDYNVHEQFEGEMSKYSPLKAQDLVDGGVDVDWFMNAYKTLKKAKWEQLYKAAKHISGGNGHTRGRLFGDAMLGNISITEVMKLTKEKRRQDHLRALGLVPLNKRSKEKDLLKRYRFIQQFLKESKQFGNQRQVSEKKAARVAMENLARTAGYPDPIRLTWAMETKEAQAILGAATAFEKDNVRITLEMDAFGKSSVMAVKDGKKLKSIPAKYRKEKGVLKLKESVKTLKDQYRRTRKSLEEAMCRGDYFTPDEITMLLGHPVVAPMMKNLVFLTENKKGIGYPAEGVLVHPSGTQYETQSKNMLCIAHCTDLYRSGLWSDFQRDCLQQERVQPFKQIYREMYLPTEDEKQQVTISKRYAGHQVNPKQTVALLKGRGWTVDYEEGLQKVYHKENFIVRLYALADWFTPSDVEPPTLETITFYKRDSYEKMPFEEVQERIFSEIMRDVDLVVSVAHVGGVDPEISHSTIEMRRALATETTTLLGLSNVVSKGNHLHIKGSVGQYSVHLGSGVVHRLPGGYVSVIPVHSQHKGRLFLPFVDDDPKSAEVLSKMLLLAEDDKIKDPTILRQLV